jgi:VWFA-related protein
MDSTRVKPVAGLALVLALAGGAGAGAQQDVFRARTEGVRMDVIVTDDDGLVLGLTPSQFEVYDAGVLQTIESIETPGTIALALAIDRSSSVRFGTWVPQYVRIGDRMGPFAVDPGWPRLLDMAGRLLGLLGPTDESALLTFGGRITRHASATRDKNRLQAQVERLASAVAGTEPFSPVVDAVAAAGSLVARRPGRPVVALLSDGVDTASWLEPLDAARALQRAGITVDLISVPPTIGHSEGVTFGAYGPEVIAEATGGRVFDATAPDVAQQLATRFAELRSSYVITYTPKGVDDVEGFHEVEIRLVGVDGRVQARQGYWAIGATKLAGHR